MEDMEDSEWYTIDEARQSRRDKNKLYIALGTVAAIFIGGTIIAAVAYGWLGLFFWLFASGLVFVAAVKTNEIRNK